MASNQGAQQYLNHSDFKEEELIVKYSTLVKRIAHHLLSRLPPTVNIEDLVQAGMIGLVEAARKFNEEKGASFSTYAGIRIRGAMLDEIRKGDWAPRSVHRNYRRVLQAIKEIENKSGKDAKDTEVAAHIGISIDEYHSIIQDSSNAKIYCLDEVYLDGNYPIGENSKQKVTGPFDEVIAQDVRKKISSEIDHLPAKEKLVLALYYQEDLNLREVGEILGVSESRVSQIHSQAMLRLQARVANWK